jgi:hypothetical protein
VAAAGLAIERFEPGFGIGGDRIDLAARLSPSLLPFGRLEAGRKENIGGLVDAAVARLAAGETEDGVH